MNENRLLIIAVVCVIFLNGCMSTAEFSEDELRFAEPFSNNQELIFKSAIGHIDTFIFGAVRVDTIRYRNIEQGHYNEIVLSVPYRLSPGSFHKLTVRSVNNEPEHFLQFARAKGSHSSKEISFLGLIFDESYIDKAIAGRKAVLNFREEEANYSGVNINEGIKSFVFHFEKGIVSYIDKNNAEWQRIND